jgi:hypothetical protein
MKEFEGTPSAEGAKEFEGTPSEAKEFPLTFSLSPHL